MRKLSFFLCLSFFTFHFSNAQWVNIPDPNFAAYLTAAHPQCMNGNQMDTGCITFYGTQVGCHNLNISSLEGIQYFDNLLYLECENNLLTSLPPLPHRLRNIVCHHNQLSSLPVLPDSLRILVFSFNLVSNLPALPGGLTALDCYGNLLDSLPALPSGLLTLSCGGLPAFRLPVLPNNLTELYCVNTQLTSLPSLPQSLTLLDCSDNQLGSLPSLPQSLTHLNCRDNQLGSLPELPDSLGTCDISNNPITCLPQLKRIVNLIFGNTLVNCVPNYGGVTNSSPSLSALPLCNILNANGCEVFYNISGKVFVDTNGNCQNDTIEAIAPNMKVKLMRGSTVLSEALTMNDGSFAFDTDSFGSYVMILDTPNIPFSAGCPWYGIQTLILTTLDSLQENKDFGIECKPGVFDLAAWSISGRFRPGSTEQVNINAGDLASFYGANCANGVNGTVQLTMNGAVSYVSPAPGAVTPNGIAGNVITWNVNDFGTANFFSDFNIMVQTDTNAIIGTNACFTLTVTPTSGDYNPANNTLTHCFIITGSFDPNDKQVSPTADIDTSQKWLSYTINFQNTGTAEAQHIYITDTLDSDLDHSSFQLLAYSHQPAVQITENAIRFNFPNINLPDSNTSEPLSHGYVQYKIKLKDNLPIGTQINNTGFIYFDFNASVVTNTTSNTIAVISGIVGSYEPLAVRVYPNPASASVNISVDAGMIGSVAILTDITGRKMEAVQLQTPNTKLETQNLAKGVYFISIYDQSGSKAVKKLVIE